MPSGGHGGSSGSHSSGGGGSYSGGGGSGFFGGDSSWRGNRGGTRIYVFFGKKYYPANNQNFSLIQFIVPMIFLLLFSVIFLLVPVLNTNKARKIESDYYRYSDMISYAQTHDDYLILGKVNSMYPYDSENESGKYYITYSFVAPSDSSCVIKGFSYSIYTYSQARYLVTNYSSGGYEIALEISKYDIDATNYLTVDSVGTDYIYYSLQDDIEGLLIIFEILEYYFNNGKEMSKYYDGQNLIVNKFNKLGGNELINKYINYKNEKLTEQLAYILKEYY